MFGLLVLKLFDLTLLFDSLVAKNKKWHQTPFLHMSKGKMVSDAIVFGADLSGYGITTEMLGIKTRPQNPVPHRPIPADLPVMLPLSGQAAGEHFATRWGHS